jgi:1-phosphatidylinositol-4-phosphate 5-kinase
LFCITLTNTLQYSVIKRLEHFFKGLANTESQISAIPPERYGDRFVKFISGVTKTKEAAEREKNEEALKVANDVTVPSMSRRSTDKVMEKAEHQLERSRKQGVNEHDVPNMAMRVVRSPSADRGEIGTTLPVVEEAGESSSVGGRSNRSNDNRSNEPHAYSLPLHTRENGVLPLQSQPRSREQSHGRPPPTPPKDSGTASEERPPTPPKDNLFVHRHSGPPTPPKENRGRSAAQNKDLPRTPLETTIRVN